jgi:hypothetical protein
MSGWKFNNGNRGNDARSTFGGNEMAETEKESQASGFDGFAKVGRDIFSIEGAKKFAAWYIDTSEKFALDAIDLQARATDWAKDTPLGPIFAAQQDFGRKVVERSADAARSLWRLN